MISTDDLAAPDPPGPILGKESWRNLAQGTVTALLTRGTGVVLSMATAIVTARALGPEGKGILAFLSTCAALAARAGSFGLDASFAHFFLVRGRSLQACLGAAAWISLVSGIAAGTVCGLLVLAFPAMRTGAPLALALPFFAAMPAYFVIFVSTFVFFALGRQTWFGIFDVSYRAATLGGMAIALLMLHGTVTAAVWIQISVAVVFASVAAVAAGRAVNWRLGFDVALVRDMLRQGAPFYSYALFRYALCYGGVLVAGILLSPTEAGLFAVSLMLGEGMLLFAGAVNLAFYPAVATMTDRRSYTTAVAKRLSVLSLAMGILLAFGARPLVQTVYGPAFLPSVRPFWLMLPGLILLTLEQVISSYYAARRMPWRIVLTLSAGCAAALILAVPLTRQRGLTGLALAISVAQTAVSLTVLQQFIRNPDDRVV